MDNSSFECCKHHKLCKTLWRFFSESGFRKKITENWNWCYFTDFLMPIIWIMSFCRILYLYFSKLLWINCISIFWLIHNTIMTLIAYDCFVWLNSITFKFLFLFLQLLKRLIDNSFKLWPTDAQNTCTEKLS